MNLRRNSLISVNKDQYFEVYELVNKLPVKEKLKIISDLSQKIHHEYNIPIQEIIESIKEKPSDLELPISIFNNQKLSSLESIVKYLKEEKQLELKQIAEITNRSQKTIWTTYNNSKKKFSARLNSSDFSFSIPISLFKDRSFSVLEIIVFYLHNTYELSIKKISNLLNRNYKTIWTVFSRVRGKMNK